MLITGLPPIVGQDPKVSILGSMPGERSLRLQQYYANPGNSFWFIWGEICGAKPELPYAERAMRLAQAGIALWDVLKHCERTGSLDNHILSNTEIPNEFTDFLQLHSTIELICFNGQKAAKLFTKWAIPTFSRDLQRTVSLKALPSTSPANTTQTKVEKTELWAQAIGPHLSLLKA